MPIPDRLEHKVKLRYTPEEVWAAISSADGLGSWLGDRALVDDLKPGGAIRLGWHGDDADVEIRIVRVEEVQSLGWSWPVKGLPAYDPRRTYVEFRLEEGELGTILTVTESGFAQLPDNMIYMSYEPSVAGWTHQLTRLVKHLESVS